jgi:hypothetical protein
MTDHVRQLRLGAAHVQRAAADLGVPVIGHDELESFAADLGGRRAHGAATGRLTGVVTWHI